MILLLTFLRVYKVYIFVASFRWGEGGKQHVSFFSYHSGTSGFTKSSGSSTRVAFKAETLQLPRCKTAIALITVDIT